MNRTSLHRKLDGILFPSIQYWNSEPLNKKDSQKYNDSLLLWACIISDTADSSFTRPSIETIIDCTNYLAHQDVYHVATVFKLVDKVIKNHPDHFIVWVFKGLKSQSNLYNEIFSKGVLPLIHSEDANEGDSFFFMNTLLNFFSRVSLKIPVKDQMIADYKSIEAHLADFHLPCTKPLNMIMREWIKDYKIDFNPKHGNGSTSNCRGRDKSLKSKYLDEYSDQRLEYLLNGVENSDQFFYCLKKGLDRTSRVIFVPKSTRTLRTISMEPTTLQFLQQSTMSNLYRFIHDHPYLKYRIPIDNQDQNKRLAQIGARTRGYATIDLSSASDTVSWKLVKEVFAGTSLLRELVCTRSDYTLLPNGEKVKLEKYAPMGSALAFPIECLIFACVVEFCYRNSTIYGLWPYSIYGDDIIVDTRVSEEVMSSLRDFGFIVNDDKSFTDPVLPFRESCGGEYLRHIDVSPIRIPRKFNGLRIDDPENFDTLRTFANNLYWFKSTRQKVLEPLLSMPKSMRPAFCTDSTVGIRSSHCTNFHLLRTKYRGETAVVHGRLSTKYAPRKEIDEAIRLHHWFVSRGDCLEGHESHIEITSQKIVRCKTSLSTLW